MIRDVVDRGWHGLGAALALLAGLGLGAPQPAKAQDRQAAATCPPVAQAPTAEQLQAGLAAARDRGFLWRISRDGRSSYLFGTMHLGRLDWVFPGPVLRTALQASDTLALELDITDPATLGAIGEAMAGGPAIVPLPGDLEQRLRRQIAAACLPPQVLDGQHPVMRVITLTALAARWEGLDPGYSQEAMLGGWARARGMPIVALEHPRDQIAALMPSQPAGALEALHSGLTQLESGAPRRVSARLAQAWAESRLADIADYEHWCECVVSDADRQQMRRLNDGRNPALADAIADQHARGRRVLAAVGALHMTGEQALPDLLTRRGFVVERLVPPP